MSKMVDLTGQFFGAWVVVRKSNARGAGLWVCKCECGVLKDVRSSNLRSGKTRSCESCRKNRGPRLAAGQQKENARVYDVWRQMILRCHSVTRPEYGRYGGRGITVCDEWRLSFKTFKADMGPRPIGFQIDRTDNLKGYSAENCRWVSPVVNQRNRRSSRLLDFCGQRKTQAEWAELLGCSQQKIYQRLRAGWPVARALSEMS